MNIYTKEKGIHDPEDLIDYDNYIEPEKLYSREVAATTFNIDDGYKPSQIPKKLICKSCGGDDFKVGQAYCFTAIKCAKCDWEECVHDG